MGRHNVNQVGYEALADAIVDRAIKDTQNIPFLAYEHICFAEDDPCPYMLKNDCFKTNKRGKKYFAVKNKDDYFYSCQLKEHLLYRSLMRFFESEWFEILLYGKDVDSFLSYHQIFI